jgi:hypothetical protein
VAVWEYRGAEPHALHKEELTLQYVHPTSGATREADPEDLAPDGSRGARRVRRCRPARRPTLNLIAVPKADADLAMDAAACIGRGASVAACPNGAGQRFTAAKLAHLNLLPQGQPERHQCTLAMVEAADEAIRLAVEFDALERVLPRIDAWLRVAVGAVSDDPGPTPFGEGPA